MPSARRAGIAIAVSAFVALILVAVSTHPAAAQFTSGFDPAGTAVSFVNSNGWLSKAQTWARQIYIGILVFEVIALGITTLLFRENLGEFFASLCLKLVLGSVFFWFISVAGPGLGQLPGQVVTGTFGNTFGKGLGGTDDVASIAAQGAGAAAAYFAASYGMRLEDGVTASAVEVATVVPTYPDPVNCTQIYTLYSGGGTCYEEPARTAGFGRQVAEQITSGLGLMVAMAVAAIYLQFVMITIETYFVMTAGVIFVGFAATRFTSPFSQGYFSYMIGVGVKLMVFYIVLGLVGPMVLNILASAIASLVTSLVDPTGFTTLASALFGALSVIICAGLVYAVPGLASSFLTGQSTVSGAALASQAMRSLSGGAQMMAQLASSSQSRREMIKDEREAHEGAGGGAHGARHSGEMSPGHGGTHDSFGGAKSEAQTNGAVAGDGAKSQSVLNDTMGMQSRRPVESSAGGPAELAAESSPQRNSEQLATRSDSDSMVRSGSESAPHAAGDVATQGDADRFSANGKGGERDGRRRENDAERELDQSNLSLGYAASAIASAAPQDMGQPTAVQVRVGTPDRL